MVDDEPNAFVVAAILTSIAVGIGWMAADHLFSIFILALVGMTGLVGWQLFEADTSGDFGDWPANDIRTEEPCRTDQSLIGDTTAKRPDGFFWGDA